MDQNQYNIYGAPQKDPAPPAKDEQPEVAQTAAEQTEMPNTGAPEAQTPPVNGQANANPYGNRGSANPYAQNPQYTGNAYAQNPYGSNLYAANPYAQNPQYGANAYTQNPYRGNGYGGRTYGQNPYYTPSPYGQNSYGQPQYNPYAPPYGQGNPVYAQPNVGRTQPFGPQLVQRQRETKSIKLLSNAHGLAVLGFSVFALIVGMILRSIPGFYEAYTGNQVFQTALNTVYSLIVIFVPFFLAGLLLKKREALKTLPLGTAYQPKAALPLIFAGLACCIAGSYASSIFGSIVEGIFGIHFTMPEDDTVINSVPMFLLTVLGTAVVPALVEEFAIRGVVMQPLRKYGDKFAIVMSAFVFALMHGNMVQIPFAFIAGLAIGYAVVVTGTMWTGIAIHFLNNFVSVLMQTAVDNLSDEQSTLVVLGLVVAIFAVGGICALIYVKTSSRTPLSKGEALLPTAEKNKAYLCTVPMILAILYLVVETAQYVEF